ncbi:MAG: DUF1592 domain-containing protein, partial [Gammaproteobacteria bacterium]|nr:DUF1592 domain-containing protein [Gammaproteobacteria bacterium]
NAIRDLLALDIDATTLLPNDESGHGFDNVNVGDLSPALLDRYISAAQKIARLAIGTTQSSIESNVIRVQADVTQEAHVPGLPIGTRGGVLIPYTFAQDGDYDIQIWLMRDRNEAVEGLTEPYQLEVLLDRKVVRSFTIEPPTDLRDYSQVDKHLMVRMPVTAGPHDLGVTFPRSRSSLQETARQPLQSHFNMHRHPRMTPAIFQVSITGPYAAAGADDTPSRRRIFVANPSTVSEEEDCAQQILATLMRRAYRRPVSDEDVAGPMAFFSQGRAEGNFDTGIERALTAVLVSPEFLFRVESEPHDAPPGTVYRISEFELASRLSFFIWSSIPDDELLDAAVRGELSQPLNLEKQVKRMLADPRAYNLASNFVGQWLHLRKLEGWRPDARLFPDVDANLRQAFRTETELFVDSVLRENRSVLDLLRADYTFLNERLAKHYGIAGVYGTRFRRVQLDSDSERGGVLRHGSVLSVTSHATRTSPVIRGKWVLDNIFGAPPPSPPPNVPTLDNTIVSASLPIRERLKEHRTRLECASCHKTIDPVGFALENFDAVGRWRDYDDGVPIDVLGGLPDGSQFDGVAGLEAGLLQRPELFAETLTEKLLTFALGRGVEYYDAPAVRKILREAKSEQYRFSTLILGIVRSAPFQMRTST